MSFRINPLPTTGSFGFRVTGLTEAVNGLDGVMREWPTVRTAVLNEAARFLVNEAQKNVHVVSGDLKKSISIEGAASNRNSIVVSAKTRYAAIENARRGDKTPRKGSKGPYGPHDFMSRAVKSTEQIFSSRIKINFDRLWSKHKTR